MREPLICDHKNQMDDHAYSKTHFHARKQEKETKVRKLYEFEIGVHETIELIIIHETRDKWYKALIFSIPFPSLKN